MYDKRRGYYNRTNTNFIVFGLTRSGLEPTIYRTRGEHDNHYTNGAVQMESVWTNSVQVLNSLSLLYLSTDLLKHNCPNPSPKTMRNMCLFFALMFSNTCLRLLMMLHFVLYQIFWFRAIQSMLFLLSAAYKVEKQEMSIL
jgi:hypothetical protein